MARYKKGDKVFIRKDLKQGYNSKSKHLVSCAQLEYSGKIATITDVVPSTGGKVYYDIDIDHGCWCWYNRCFIRYSPEDPRIGRVYETLPHGPCYTSMGHWFTQSTTPKHLRKEVKNFTTGNRIPEAGPYTVIGIAPHLWGHDAALLKNYKTGEVYLYDARRLPDEED